MSKATKNEHGVTTLAEYVNKAARRALARAGYPPHIPTTLAAAIRQAYPRR